MFKTLTKHCWVVGLCFFVMEVYSIQNTQTDKKFDTLWNQAVYGEESYLKRIEKFKQLLSLSAEFSPQKKQVLINSIKNLVVAHPGNDNKLNALRNLLDEAIACRGLSVYRKNFENLRAQLKGEFKSFSLKAGDIVRLKSLATGGYLTCRPILDKNEMQKFKVGVCNESKQVASSGATCFKVKIKQEIDKKTSEPMTELVPLYVEQNDELVKLNDDYKLAAFAKFKRGGLVNKQVTLVAANDSLSSKNVGAQTLFVLRKKSNTSACDVVELFNPALKLSISCDLLTKSIGGWQELTLQEEKALSNTQSKASCFQLQRMELADLQRLQSAQIQKLLERSKDVKSLNEKLDNFSSVINSITLPLTSKESQRILQLFEEVAALPETDDIVQLKKKRAFWASVNVNKFFSSEADDVKKYLENIDSNLNTLVAGARVDSDIEKKLLFIDQDSNYVNKIKSMDSVLPLLRDKSSGNYVEKFLNTTQKLMSLNDELSFSELASLKKIVDKILSFDWHFALNSPVANTYKKIQEKQPDFVFKITLAEANVAVGGEQIQKYKTLFDRITKMNDDQKIEFVQSLKKTFNSKVSEAKTIKELMLSVRQKIL